MWRFFRFLIRPAFGFSIFGIDDMAFAVMASGALNFGGNMLGGLMQSQGASESNALQYQMFEENLAFQREAMQNKIQWQTADMRAAGLNPILAASMGAPMGMGSGIPSMQNTGTGVGSAMQAASKEASDLAMQLIKGQVDKARAEAASAKAQSDVDQSTVPARTAAIKSQATVAAANSAQRLNEMKAEQSPIGKWLTGWKTWFGGNKK